MDVFDRFPGVRMDAYRKSTVYVVTSPSLRISWPRAMDGLMKTTQISRFRLFCINSYVAYFCLRQKYHDLTEPWITRVCKMDIL